MEAGPVAALSTASHDFLAHVVRGLPSLPKSSMDNSPTKGFLAVDELIKTAHEWDGDLFFPCMDPLLPTTFAVQNLFEFSCLAFHKRKIYFDPAVFPPDGLDSDAWLRLYAGLQEAAKHSGFELIQLSKKKGKRYLGCSRSRKYCPPSKGFASGEIKQGQWTNHDRNTRGDKGLEMRRRRQTQKPICDDALCPVRLTIAVDEYGFYFEGGTATLCRHHSSHPQFQLHEFTTRTRAITSANKELLNDLSDAHASSAVGANVFFMKTKTLISTRQVRYLKLMHKSGIDPNIADGSSADGILALLQDKGYSHEVLYSRKMAQLPSGEDADKIITETICPPSLNEETDWAPLALPPEEDRNINNSRYRPKKTAISITIVSRRGMLLK
jgi:hypothetical protein